MKTIIIAGLLGLSSLMGLKCGESGTMIPVIEKASLKASITSNRTKPSVETDLVRNVAIVHPIVSYSIEKDQLGHYYLFEPTPASGCDPALWMREKNNKASHQKLFNLFAQIIPQQYREGIKYFAIIDPRQTNVENMVVYAAMGPQSYESLEPFCLYMAFDLEDYRDIPYVLHNISYTVRNCDLLVYILIHEFGHYVTMNKAQQDFIEGAFTPKKNSICEQISLRPAYQKMKDYSDETELTRYKEELLKQGEFITQYAATSYLEDAAETFAHFVLTDERPQPGVNGANDKILLFYQDPKMVEIRAAIRDNLKKLGIPLTTSNGLIYYSKLLAKLKEKVKKLIKSFT